MTKTLTPKTASERIAALGKNPTMADVQAIMEEIEIVGPSVAVAALVGAEVISQLPVKPGFVTALAVIRWVVKTEVLP